MSVESGLLCCGTLFGFVRVEDVSDEIELKCVLDTCVQLHLLNFGFHMKPLMSLVSWKDPIPFHFCIFSISALTLTYYDARNRRDASRELRESARSMLDFR